MGKDDPELKQFKSEINLTEFALSMGYEFDSKESTKTFHILRKGAISVKSGNRTVNKSAEKLIIFKAANGNYYCYSARDTVLRAGKKGGTIIDLVRHELGIENFGRIRQYLRAYAGTSRPAAIMPVRPTVQPSVDFAREYIAHKHGHLKPYTGTYLTRERKISPVVVASFASSIRQNFFGTACFTHRDRHGVTGWEIRGVPIPAEGEDQGFSGKSFSKGGMKSVFVGRPNTDKTPIDTIVVTESAIDALSYCELHGHPGMMYVSTAGEFSDRQLAIVVSMAKAGARQVLSAFDDDTNGEKYHAKLIAALPATRWEIPRSLDWNQDLKDAPSLNAGYREISEAEFLSQVTLHNDTSSQEEILCSR